MQRNTHGGYPPHQQTGYYQTPQPQSAMPQQQAMPYVPAQQNGVMSGGAKAGWLLLSMFLGTLGFIITALVCHGKSDAYAHTATKMSLIGLIVSTVLAIVAVIILMVFSIAMLGALASAM